MDNGRPFRVPQSGDRRAANRPEQAYRPTDEPRQQNEPPRSAPTAGASRPQHISHDEKPKGRFKLPLIILVVVVVAALGWFMWSKMQNTAVAIDGSKYQAVFFTNGQVYFGKLQSANSDYLKLTDIYYLQTQGEQAADSQNPQQSTNAQKDVQLIKLGDEIHGPEDAMVISKEQVLFYENLKSDGKVAQSIAQFKSAH